MASFLSDPITQGQAATVETFFRLGLAAEQSRQQAAADQASHEHDILVQQQAEAQRQLLVRQLANEEHAYEAQLKAKDIAAQQADKFTENMRAAAAALVNHKEQNAERFYAPLANDPKYSPATHTAIASYFNQVGNAGESLLTSLATLKPGESPDVAGYLAKIGSIQTPTIDFDPDYTNYLRSQTDKNKAETKKALSKTGHGGGTSSSSSALSNYQDAMLKLNEAHTMLSQNKNDPDLDVARAVAITKGVDPDMFEKKQAYDATVAAKQWGLVAYQQFRKNPNIVSDPYARSVAEKLVNDGVNPWDPDAIPTVSKTIKNQYDQQDNPDARRRLSDAHYYFTGSQIPSSTVEASSPLPMSVPQGASAVQFSAPIMTPF